MKILGIDPGIGRAGWGVIEVANGKPGLNRGRWQMANCGCIETAKELKTEERLSQLYEALMEIIEKEKPDAMAVEDLFFSTNAKTAMIVGEARGVILLAGSQKGLPLSTYTPLQVKIAVAGYGKAEKLQVEKMMMLQLGLKTKPKIDDTADALAIALTHAFSYQLERVKRQSK